MYYIILGTEKKQNTASRPGTLFWVALSRSYFSLLFTLKT